MEPEANHFLKISGDQNVGGGLPPMTDCQPKHFQLTHRCRDQQRNATGCEATYIALISPPSLLINDRAWNPEKEAHFGCTKGASLCRTKYPQPKPSAPPPSQTAEKTKAI